MPCNIPIEEKIQEIMKALGVSRDIAVKHVQIQTQKNTVDARIMQVKINNMPVNPDERVEHVVQATKTGTKPEPVVSVENNIDSRQEYTGYFELHNELKDYDVEIDMKKEVEIKEVGKNGLMIKPEGWEFGVTIDKTTGKNQKGTWSVDPTHLPTLENVESVTAEGNGWTKYEGMYKDLNAYTKPYEDKKFPNVELFMQYNVDNGAFTIREKNTEANIGFNSKTRDAAIQMYENALEKNDIDEKKFLEKIALMKTEVEEQFKKAEEESKESKEDKEKRKKEFRKKYPQVDPSKTINKENNNETIYIANKAARERAHIDKKGVLTTRINKDLPGIVNMNKDFHFGNPFPTEEFGGMKGQTGEIVSKRYEAWLDGKSDTKVQIHRRDWINQMINEGKLDDVRLIYWKNVDTLTHDKILSERIKNKSIEVKKSKEPTVTEPEETHPSDAKDPKYKVTDGIYMNDGQRHATDALNKFIKNDKLSGSDAVFMLNGRGGTGKSTIIKAAIDGDDDIYSSVNYYAPTWKASKVLSAMSGEEVKTVASGLNMKPNIDKNGKQNGFKPEFNSMFPPSISQADIIIVDEGSMISQEIFDLIMDVKKDHAKVIFMGDNVQFPPVESPMVNGVKEDSPVFRAKHQAKLTKRMRQNDKSPILPITDQFAEAVEANKQEEIQFDRTSQYDAATNTGLKYTNANDLNSVVDEFLVDYKENPKTTRMITYNNENKMTVPDSSGSLNEIARLKLFGKEAKKHRFFEGEIIYGLDKAMPVPGGMKTNHDGDPITMENGSEYEITSLKPIQDHNMMYKSNDGKSVYSLDVTGYLVELTDIIDDTEAGTYFIPSKSGLAQIKNEEDRLLAAAQTDKRGWKQFYGLKSGYPKVTYAYAINGHKSQGSTYRNVYMMEDNILHSKSAAWTAKERNQGAYVASSRAAKKLVMVSQKNPQEEVNNGNPEVVETQGSTLKTANLFGDNPQGTFAFENAEFDLNEKHNEQSALRLLFESYLEQDMNENVGGIGFGISPEFMHIQARMVAEMEKAFENGATSNITLTEYETAVGEEMDTAGSIDHMSDNTAGVNLRWNQEHGTARKSEVFMHEIIHFMTNRAFKLKPDLQTILTALKKKARESGITHEIFLTDLLQNGIAPTENEIQIAKDKFAYVFSKHADPEEFFAYAVTNEHVYNAIKDLKIEPEFISTWDIEAGEKGVGVALKKVFNAIIKAVNAAWSAVAGAGGKDGAKIVVDTMTELVSLQALLDEEEAAIDTTSAEAREAQGVIDNLNDKIAPWTQKFDDKLEAFSNTVVKSNKFEKAAKRLEKTMIIGDIIQTHFVQNIITSITQKTDNKKWSHLFELFRQGKNFTEKHRKGISDALERVVGEYFEDVDSETRKAISTVIFNLDIPSMIDVDKGIDLDQLREILKNEENAKEIYDASYREVEVLYMAKNRTSRGDHYGQDTALEFKNDIEQAIALAKGLVTGGVHTQNQQMNADNIYNKYYMSGKNNVEIDPNINTGSEDVAIINALNKFITVAGIKASPQTDKTIVYDYLAEAENRKNITSMIAMYKKYVLDTIEDLEINNFNPVQKGFFEQQNAAKITYDLVPESELEYYIGRFGGMVKIGEYGVINGIKYYELSGREHTVGFDEGMFSISGNTVPGLSLKMILTQQLTLENNNERKRNKISIDNINKTVENMMQRYIESGGTDTSIVNGLENQQFLPVYDAIGNIIDYHVNATTYKKVKHMESNLDVVKSAAFTFSKMKHRQASTQHNKEVVNTLLQYHEDNLDEENFIVLERHEDGVFNEDIHGRWNRLPEATRNYIFMKTGKHAIAIPKNMMEMITGEKEVTLSNLNIGPIDLRGKKKVQKTILAFEDYIQEIWAYVKESIAIRMGGVVAANTLSNMLQAWVHGGIDPIDYMKIGRRKWQELNEYTELMRDLDIESVKLAGEGDKPTKGTINKIKILSARIEKNSFHTLVQDGQFSPIIEDVNVDEEANGHIARMIEKGMNHNEFTKKVKPIKEFVMMDRNTPVYQTMLKITQYGDIITREIMREEKEKKFLKKEGRSMSPEEKQEHLNFLDMLFVNYGYTDNRYMRYLERTFGVMFTKYLFRQAKAMHSVATQAPARLGTMLTAEQLTGVDLTTADDDYWRFFEAMSGRFDIDNPYEMLMSAGSPKIASVLPNLGDLYS